MTSRLISTITAVVALRHHHRLLLLGAEANILITAEVEVAALSLVEGEDGKIAVGTEAEEVAAFEAAEAAIEARL